MATAADQLVGRVEELDALDRAVSGLADSGASTLVCSESPESARRGSFPSSARVPTPQARSCCPAARPSSSGPAVLGVRRRPRRVRGRPRATRLETLEPDVRAELGRILPSLSDAAPSGEAALQDERYRAHRAVRELLERLAATKPLVLILDDVHWADSASIELLGALLRRPPSAPVLLCSPPGRASCPSGSPSRSSGRAGPARSRGWSWARSPARTRRAPGQ